MNASVLRFWLFVLASCVFSGCQHEEELPTFPVQGRVTYTDGSPVASGIVSFSIQLEGQRVTARGLLDEHGKYRLSTRVPNDGAVAGIHQVTLQPSPTAGTMADRLQSVIPEKYWNLTTTDLELEITEGGNDILLEIERP
ncbi:MAG: hypothetical protein MK179_17325 [Pirellulaceae bacterium]|nr:hypothetical protein [Pirellulaceae bacterium]